MKRAILVVSFGTSHPDTREKNITKLENDIKEKFSDDLVCGAFTSSIILKILKKRGEEIFSVNEALEYLVSQEVTDLIVQPTHIIPGHEYEKLKNDVLKFKDNFDTISIGKTLLEDIEDSIKVAVILHNQFPLKEDEALVFMGHGSTNFANYIYPAMNYIFDEKYNDNIFVGTVEAYPDFDAVLKQLKLSSVKKVFLTPLMLVAGDHAKNDMVENDDSWKNELIKEGYEVETIVKGLGEYEQIREIYIEHISSATSIK